MSRENRANYLVGFDTEDDGNGNPFLFCFVHEGGSFVARNRGDALYFLRSLGERIWKEGKRVQAWATNLEYDLVNLFGPDEIRHVSLRFGKSALIAAQWKRVQFRDTVRHVPASVKELGELIGLPKLERDTSEAYCLRDATITFRTAGMVREFYTDRFDVQPKSTLAASAYAVWKERFWKRDVVRPPGEIREAAQAAYFGGRTEPFAIGKFRKIQAIDACSMFPWAMTAAPLPLPWGNFRRVRPKEEVKPNGLYRVGVTAPVGVVLPVLPYRSEVGLSFPVGDWRGWYVGEELLYAISLGYKIEVRAGFEFLDSSEPFGDYVATMFEGKNKSRGTMRHFYKLLLNSLYGKFGQKGANVRAVPVEEFARLKKAPINFSVWNGVAFWTQEGSPPPWGNFVWPAWITARARVKLAQEIVAIKSKGGVPLYCDTDSVYFIPGKTEFKYPASGARPGQFEDRGKFAEIVIAGKKEYGLRIGRKWEIHAKGIPRDSRLEYLTTGKAEFRLPVKIREAARRGLQANSWIDRKKQRRVNFRSRTKSDGSLSRILISGGKGNGG